MKRDMLSKLACLILLLAAITCCSREDVVDVGTSNGSLSLQLLSQEQAARSINPNAEFRATSYEVSGQGPEGATYGKVEVTTATPLLSNLDAGLWTFTVSAKNKAGVEIAKGTGEMVVAYNTAGMLDKANQYLEEMEKLFVAGVTPGLYGIPYASNNETHFGTGGLWTGVDTKPSVSSSSWYLLGKLRYDPMAILRNKNIPESHKFWK